MSTIDFNKPATTDNYSTAFVPALNGNFQSLGFMLDPLYVTAITNPITGMQRVNSVTKLIEFFNGTSWVERVMDFARLSGTGGSGSIAFTQAVNSSVGFNGILGGTTPAAATVTTLTASGLASLGAGANVTGQLNVNTTSTNGNVTFTNTGTNGVQFVLTGNGAVTPNKYIRLLGGTFDIVNSAYTAAIWSLTDAGVMTAPTITASTALNGTLGTAAQPNITSVGTLAGLTLSGPLNLGSSAINAVGNIFGPAASGAYTISAEPVGTFSSGALVQLYGSAHANTGRLILNAGTATGLIDFTINNVSKLTLNSNGTLNAKGGAYTTAVAVAFSATPTFDLKASNFQVFGNLTANVTAVTLTNNVEGQLVTIRLRQDATGGRTFTTGNMGATNAPAVSGSVNTAANKTTMMTVAYNATDLRYDIMYSQLN